LDFPEKQIAELEDLFHLNFRELLEAINEFIIDANEYILGNLVTLLDFNKFYSTQQFAK